MFQVDFDEKKSDTIIGMRSDLGEKVPFEKSVQCTGGVEFWLNSLLQTVKDTVKTVIAAQAQCFVDPNYDFVTNFVPFCGQVGDRRFPSKHTLNGFARRLVWWASRSCGLKRLK